MNQEKQGSGLSSLQVRRLTYAALYLAIALVLPFITGQIPEIGKRLSPMHIPLLLCGFMCGWPYGLAVGFIAPLLSSALNGMPGLFPDAVVMAFELAAYGALSGLLYRLLPKKKWSIYAALIGAMLAGRIVYGIVYLFLTGLGLVKINDALLAFVWVRAFAKPFAGIILQIALVPLLVMVLERARLILNNRRTVQ